ncbi:MAG TPA: MgtC/SapB family protein [Chitinophaga sp.]|uniref:MgtC/SapB family protein n=1 Tax=Chitinophaga sp. TaxID=1869181 RepID=UPI002C896DAE|nr:MgtC/SapB family protein [Chitinophaga sp.]HVI47937.1 MgtC/SapB family protein [Chitinophaga sp.]
MKERIVPTLTFVTGDLFLMKHIYEIISEDQVLKILLSLLIGAAIGLEREYKRKAAGMRTMTLICVSSAVFTILSAEMGYPSSPDRIASNILTGVGFIGAGVIFKGDYTIDGVTTAAAIWIAAALGMAVGMSQYVLAFTALVGALLVLLAMEIVEKWIALVSDKRLYTIYFYEDKAPQFDVEQTLERFELKFKRMLILRKEHLIEVNYVVRGHRSKMEQLDDFLLQNKDVFQYQVQTNPF